MSRPRGAPDDRRWLGASRRQVPGGKRSLVLRDLAGEADGLAHQRGGRAADQQPHPQPHPHPMHHAREAVVTRCRDVGTPDRAEAADCASESKGASQAAVMPTQRYVAGEKRTRAEHRAGS